MSSPKLKQGYLRNIAMPAWCSRLMINLWPPMIGAGIHVEHIAADYSEARVRMRQRLLNSNLFGTHFGGSLFAMTDPFYTLLILHRLGKDYVVWDKRSEIDFLLPARGTVSASFSVSTETIAEIRRRTDGGDKYEPDFTVEITDPRGEIVAKVTKTIYVRRKPATPALLIPSPADPPSPPHAR